MILTVALYLLALVGAGSLARLAWQHRTPITVLTGRLAAVVRWAGATSHVPLLAPHGGQHTHRRTA